MNKVNFITFLMVFYLKGKNELLVVGGGAESAVPPFTVCKHVHTSGEGATSVGLIYLQLVGNG